MEKKYKNFFEVAREIYRDEASGHGFDHIERVVSSCAEILQDTSCDEDVVIIAGCFLFFKPL